MLHIYYGRENINKEKFLFENIKGQTLLLVPDQFTLQAERSAFFYLKTKGFMENLEVVSISRLGLKVLQEVGGKKEMINRYGKHMLLAKILWDKTEQLNLYKEHGRKASFIEMVNDFISEMKQYSTSPEELESILEGIEGETFLKMKLEDIHTIYKAYEKEISGKYTDTEDYIDLFAEKISRSEKLKKVNVWVYGFDYFTPKNLTVIEELMKTCLDVNILLTCSQERETRYGEIFHITQSMVDKLTEIANKQDVLSEKTAVPGDYRIDLEEKLPSLLHLEKEIFAFPADPCKTCQGIKLVQAANFYGEAESAAAHVRKLVREEGIRYKDIMIICNDLDARGSIAKRVFAEYGMDLFIDKKRSFLHSPAVSYILSLINISVKGYQTSEIFKLLKTGLSAMEWEDVEELENYTIKYKIRGNMWKKEFFRGSSEYSAEELARLNQSREYIVDLLTTFREGFQKEHTVEGKVRFLYAFLAEQAELPEKLELLMESQRSRGFYDIAGETAQAWNVIMDIFDQLVQLLGEDELSEEMLAQILTAGFESIEIGLLPPTADGLVMGTMQRTRSSNVKHMLVLGANDGTLPLNVKTESLLNSQEKKKLFAEDIEICKLDDLRIQEEKIAIYKNLSKPTEGIWMSYSVSDLDGAELRPSMIFGQMRKIFPQLEVEKDINNQAEDLARIEAPAATLRHMVETLHEVLSEAETEELESPWKEALLWYCDHKENSIRTVRQGLTFTNKQNSLQENVVKDLFLKKDKELLSLSPSGLEKYSKCPFAYFIGYGIRPRERRVFEIGGREIGDVYHVVLMRFSKRLSQAGFPAHHEESLWKTVTKEETDTIIEEILADETKDYREGVFERGEEEKYRTARLQKICKETAWALVEHVRGEEISGMIFEEAFGEGRKIPPVEISLGDKTVIIEGKIDRADFMTGDKVRIIDYKTGRETFQMKEAEDGWKLQLMIYLKAVQKKEKAAGIFYFLIGEPYVDMTGKSGENVKEIISEEVMKKFQLKGLEIIDGEKTGAGKMNREEFEEFQSKVDNTISELCAQFSSGNIDIKPKKNKLMSACTYCLYKSICMFDKDFQF